MFEKINHERRFHHNLNLQYEEYYKNGKTSEVREFFTNGNLQYQKYYDKDGKYIWTRCWDKYSPKEIECGSSYEIKIQIQDIQEYEWDENLFK